MAEEHKFGSRHGHKAKHISHMPARRSYNEEATVVKGEVIGYRAWRVTWTGKESLFLPSQGKLRLASAYFDLVWTSPAMVADRVPRLDNANGIYAVKDWTDQKYLQDHTDYFYTRPIIGTVALSGDTVFGSRGYRAQRAVIRELYWSWWEGRMRTLYNVNDEAIAEMCDTYQVVGGIRPTPTFLRNWRVAIDMGFVSAEAYWGENLAYLDPRRANPNDD